MNSQFTNPWIIRAIGFLCFCITLLSCTPTKEEITLTPADQWSAEDNYQNFQIQGQALTEKDAEAALLFHTDGESGYEVLFHNGPIDGSRKWTATFSQEALGIFDYLFTDAMTIMDHKNRNSRIYRAEEVHYDGVSKEQYMEQIVDQTIKILTKEPADIFANPTYIPEDMQADYDKYWTDERINRVLDVMQEHNIALEINPRYKIPSMKIIQMAKDRGMKFVFGTNNVDANFGKLEYCIEAIEQCGITTKDLWFPSMSIRKERPVVIYNTFN